MDEYDVNHMFADLYELGNVDLPADERHATYLRLFSFMNNLVITTAAVDTACRAEVTD